MAKSYAIVVYIGNVRTYVRINMSIARFFFLDYVSDEIKSNIDFVKTLEEASFMFHLPVAKGIVNKLSYMYQDKVFNIQIVK